MLNVTIWNEFIHEKEHKDIAEIYPDGIHGELARFLGTDEKLSITTATLDMEEHGLPKEVIDNTDVLIWWGHSAHDKVSDEVAQRVQEAVLKGMGLIVLHSGHLAKPFKLLLGTSCTLLWRDNDRERIWCCNPSHPIAKGIPAHFELEREEMYGEFFDIPKPDDIIFLGWFKGGEVFRSGVTFTRNRGKIFYFQPGHESFPTYHNEFIRKIIHNAVHFVSPTEKIEKLDCPNPQPLEQ
ncbi:MAG: trehalose utilization protein ThuA [Clostridiales bacterium 43-6]|nr:MAG: trehalose utilization protein ThuA [Clostridiales bacterium 43-6]